MVTKFMWDNIKSLRLVPRNRGRKPCYEFIASFFIGLYSLRLVPRNRGRKQH